MHKAEAALRKGILYISALVLVAGYPTAAMATSQEPVTNPEQAVISLETPQEAEKQIEYTYDPTTKKWNSDEWQFNPESGVYEKPPAPIIVEPETSDVGEAEGQNSSNSNTTVNVTNEIQSDATSGDAIISGNSAAGSALSGDATAVANIMNAVNSSVTTDGNKKIATFTKDIMGDVKGDIVLYPMLLKAMLEAQAGELGSAGSINTTTDFNVNNNVEINATSGNATVSGNTTAGNATSGNATAMANVINILNSMIAAQESFIGTINIYGSLDGDILIAPDFIPQMLAHNGGSEGSPTQLSTQDTTTIVNNISAVAKSGAASVFGNTTGGDASTGDADSNVVIFNVTGREIVAENSMLIFVNVLGKWVGMILDAPEGATAAMVGSGVTKNEKYAPDLTLKAESNHGITNTIAVNATSGDATVSDNTTGGNATSGNANALVNVANVSNSAINLSGWFRVLTFNIFGDWNGGVKIAQNNPQSETGGATSLPPPTGPVQFVPEAERPAVRAASITRTIIDSRFLQNSSGSVAVSVASDTQTETSEVPAEADVKGVMDVDETTSDEVSKEANNLFLIVVGSIILAGASFVGIRRFI